MRHESTFVMQLIKELEDLSFYGSLEVKFESGKVVVVKKIETLKPPTFNRYRDNRGNNAEG